MREATLSPGVQLQDPEQLAGLQERIVAVESGVFLACQLSSLLPYLSSSLGPDTAVDTFYSSTVAAAQDLREPVYLAAVAASLDTSAIVAKMAKVAWDLREVSTQHSPYVELWLQQLSTFSRRLTKLAALVTVPPDLATVLWTQVVRVVTSGFVEGFASAKRCTNEGRALMQLDFRQFVIQVSSLHLRSSSFLRQRS